MCPTCRKPVTSCACRTNTDAATADSVVRVSRQTAGHGGKAVTVIKGLALDVPTLTKLGKQLKATCGTGGTVKDGAIELQGDHCAAVMEILEKQGMTVKRSGG